MLYQVEDPSGVEMIESLSAVVYPIAISVVVLAVIFWGVTLVARRRNEAVLEQDAIEGGPLTAEEWDELDRLQPNLKYEAWKHQEGVTTGADFEATAAMVARAEALKRRADAYPDGSQDRY